MPGLVDLILDWLRGYPAGRERLLSLVGIEVHWAILQYVLGLPLLAVFAEAIWLRTGNEYWKRLSRNLAKGFTVVFAVGAASGTASEFGLILLWPNLTEAAGRYIYFPLYLEIFAFMTEVAFIYLYFYADGRVSPRVHLLMGVAALAGAWFSGAMILSVNSFMQSPANVLANYDPSTGAWAPPEVLLYVPTQVAQALDAQRLAEVGGRILDSGADYVLVSLPAGLVRALMSQAFAGYTVGDSLLAAVARPEAAQALASVPLKSVLDSIVANTVRHAGVYSITFKSGTYVATFVHSVGAAVTVSAFTVMGAYALRLLRTAEDDPDREYFLRAFRFAALAALVAVAIQGTGSGHAMGAAVAEFNPEKLAAMEGTSEQITSLPELIHAEGLVHGRLMPLLAYGSSSAVLPSYDLIHPDFRPPLVVHYLYYGKVGLGVLLGLTALAAALELRRADEPPRWVLWASSLSPILAQLVSFLGWAVREIGRKPWAIYGIMDVQTEVTVNPPPAWQLALVALYLVALLALLLSMVYLYLWRRAAATAEEGRR